MIFNERIKQLREDRQIPQRKLAAATDIDTASYYKIEKGERRIVGMLELYLDMKILAEPSATCFVVRQRC